MPIASFAGQVPGPGGHPAAATAGTARRAVGRINASLATGPVRSMVANPGLVTVALMVTALLARPCLKLHARLARALHNKRALGLGVHFAQAHVPCRTTHVAVSGPP